MSQRFPMHTVELVLREFGLRNILNWYNTDGSTVGRMLYRLFLFLFLNGLCYHTL